MLKKYQVKLYSFETWEVMASDEENALELAENGEGEFVGRQYTERYEVAEKKAKSLARS